MLFCNCVYYKEQGEILSLIIIILSLIKVIITAITHYWRKVLNLTARLFPVRDWDASTDGPDWNSHGRILN